MYLFSVYFNGELFSYGASVGIEEFCRSFARDLGSVNLRLFSDPGIPNHFILSGLYTSNTFCIWAKEIDKTELIRVKH